MPVQLALAHEHLTGGGFDLPAGRADLRRVRRRRSGSATGCASTPATSSPTRCPSADVLVMGHILHDWDLDEKRMLLEKAYAALPDGGALIVYEAMIDDDRRENAFGLLMSLNMLIETPGGFDYTGADCRGWMRDAGFRETYVEHLVGPGLDGRRDQVAAVCASDSGAPTSRQLTPRSSIQ